jgi:hypothetical protein
MTQARIGRDLWLFLAARPFAFDKFIKTAKTSVSANGKRFQLSSINWRSQGDF